MTNVIIHKDNVSFFEDFEDEIYFDNYDISDIDRYISQDILPDLLEIKPDVIYIKDNLSSNYLELLGLRVAYHIRLTDSLNYLPIVIISDLDSHILNKLDSSANILFTKNTFLIQNSKNEYDKIKDKDFKNLTQEEYQTKFLDKIRVEQPKDYLSHHSIANEWSIYKWSDILDVKSEALQINKEKIENLLYFKYLKVKQKQYENENITIKKPSKKGKVLLIDDEWNKGWSDILEKSLLKEDLIFEPFIYDYKDKTTFNLYMQIQKKIKDFDPDVIVLDLRLSQSDHNEDNNIDSFTGIKILNKIHEINAGIQVVMLTATSKSTILEKLYEKKILGYIKKEHPDDISINTVENINKFMDLVDDGLKNKYLKDIFQTKEEIINILDFDLAKDMNQNLELFDKFKIKQKIYFIHSIKIFKEVNYVFDILNSKLANKLIYAMLSIVSCFEAINSIFIKEKRYEDDVFWDDATVYNSNLNDKLEELFKKLGLKENLDIYEMIRHRNNYLHANTKKVDIKSEDINKLFKTMLTMIQTIKKY